jgi:hypothetical protein
MKDFSIKAVKISRLCLEMTNEKTLGNSVVTQFLHEGIWYGSGHSARCMALEAVKASLP